MRPRDRAAVAFAIAAHVAAPSADADETNRNLFPIGVGIDAEIELELARRVSAGIDVRVTQSLSVLAGGLYNRSAVPDPSVAGAQTEDYYGGSAGVQWQSGRTRTGLGAFLFQSVGELIPVGSQDLTPVDARTRVIGAIITTSYRL